MRNPKSAMTLFGGGVGFCVVGVLAHSPGFGIGGVGLLWIFVLCVTERFREIEHDEKIQLRFEAQAEEAVNLLRPSPAEFLAEHKAMLDEQRLQLEAEDGIFQLEMMLAEGEDHE